MCYVFYWSYASLAVLVKCYWDSVQHTKSLLYKHLQRRQNSTFTFTAICYSMHYAASQSALVEDWHWLKKGERRHVTHNHEGASTDAGARLCGCHPSNHQLVSWGCWLCSTYYCAVAAINKECPFHQAWEALAGRLGSFHSNGTTRCVQNVVGLLL